MTQRTTKEFPIPQGHPFRSKPDDLPTSSTDDLHIPPSLQPRRQLLLTDHEIRTHLIKATRAVEVSAQIHIFHLPARLVLLLLRLLLPLLRTVEIGLCQSLRAGLVDRSGQRVLVHSVQEALDDAEGDEPSHVDPGHHVRTLHAPALDAVALSQRQIQLCQVGTTQRLLLLLFLPLLGAKPVALPQSNIPPALRLHLLALHKRGHLRRGRIDGSEAEDVQQKHAAVVE